MIEYSKGHTMNQIPARGDLWMNIEFRKAEKVDPEGNLIEIGSWNKPYAEKDL